MSWWLRISDRAALRMKGWRRCHWEREDGVGLEGGALLSDLPGARNGAWWGPAMRARGTSSTARSSGSARSRHLSAGGRSSYCMIRSISCCLVPPTMSDLLCPVLLACPGGRGPAQVGTDGNKQARCARNRGPSVGLPLQGDRHYGSQADPATRSGQASEPAQVRT